MLPRRCLQRPRAVGIFVSEQLRHLAEDGVIVCRLVLAHAAPVERLGCDFGIWVTFQDVFVAPFRIGPLFVHKRESR